MRHFSISILIIYILMGLPTTLYAQETQEILPENIIFLERDTLDQIGVTTDMPILNILLVLMPVQELDFEIQPELIPYSFLVYLLDNQSLFSLFNFLHTPQDMMNTPVDDTLIAIIDQDELNDTSLIESDPRQREDFEQDTLPEFTDADHEQDENETDTFLEAPESREFEDEMTDEDMMSLDPSTDDSQNTEKETHDAYEILDEEMSQ